MTFIGAQTTAGGVLMDVENVSWNSTSSTTSFVVRNIGTSDARIVRFYAGESVSNLIEVTSNTDLGTGSPLPVDQTVTVTLSWPNALASSWTNSRTYYFKIAPEAGTPKEFTWRAPAA